MGARPAVRALRTASVVIKGLQLVALITMIGLAGKFWAALGAEDLYRPGLLGAVLWTSVILILFTAIPFEPMITKSKVDSLLPAFFDGFCLVVAVIVAGLLTPTVSWLDCPAFSDTMADTGFKFSFVQWIFANRGKTRKMAWPASDKASCVQAKALWGLSISLCILYSMCIVTCLLASRIAKRHGRKAST
ncbi:hypothetical protein E4U41_002167 [Claviceps citrina]|nr:hypothetical protein E4U41_002167 [Claviceps citrina]